MSKNPNEMSEKELKEWLLGEATPDDIEDFANADLRHKSGVKPEEYLKHWLKCLRPFGYATRDDSWGELEKLFSISYRNMVIARRKAEQ